MKFIIAGVDEVGRGSLIGPVYAAAVILKKKLDNGIKALQKKEKAIQEEESRAVISNLVRQRPYWQVMRSKRLLLKPLFRRKHTLNLLSVVGWLTHWLLPRGEREWWQVK